MSQQLAVLEREVGVPLLEKAGRGVRPTDAARVLSRHAATLLFAAEAAAGTGHRAVVVGTCRALDGFEPDLRCRSDDAEVQLEFIRRMVRWDWCPRSSCRPRIPS